MGGVLILFDTGFFIARLGYTGEDAAILEREVFRSLEWARMDRGSISEEDACAAICSRTPGHLHNAVRALVGMWDRPILPIEGIAGLIRELKENGYHIYLLSNASKRQHDYWSKVPGNEFFDDTLISADVGLIKPQPEIYRLACEKFHVCPEECLFIDDMPANAEGAFCTGMHAFVFHNDTGELRTWLKKNGILTE